MQMTATHTDRMFRRFQIQKFDRKLMVPAVTMTMNVDATRLLETKQKLNGQRIAIPRITVTHLVVKAVAAGLVNYPILYSFFNGSRIIDNPELVLNIPVDIENHVDYLIVRNPDSKTLIDIARECEHELEKINQNEGEFLTYLTRINRSLPHGCANCPGGFQGRRSISCANTMVISSFPTLGPLMSTRGRWPFRNR